MLPIIYEKVFQKKLVATILSNVLELSLKNAWDWYLSVKHISSSSDWKSELAEKNWWKILISKEGIFSILDY